MCPPPCCPTHLALSQSNTLSCRDIDARSARYDPADSLVPEHERLKKVLRARAALGASPALAADELLLKKDLG